ncbi:MAG: GNAT family N-acetyltransferase [Candidatus Hodarchaeota archaeon]
MRFLLDIELWVDRKEDPDVLKYSIPYIHFFAGNPENPCIDKLFAKVNKHHQFFIPNKSWEIKIKQYWGDKLQSYKRNKLDHSKLDLYSIQKISKKSLPNGFIIKEIDLKTVEFINQNISNYFSLYFGSPAEFMNKGVGYCIKKGDDLASFATCFLPFKDKLEVQVITLKKYRRKGFAFVVCAKLIEYCLLRKITPCWDACNESSLMLALKLGYSNPMLYDCYYWQINY